MDEIVKAALKKWPKVPHCWGWLALDARGNWSMRDERVQRAGPFPQVKGSRILHEKLALLLETSHADLVRGILEVLYRQVVAVDATIGR